MAQSGLYAVQGLGILAGGAAAQAIGAPLAVGLAGLVGVTAATMLAMSWTHLRGRLIQAQRGEAEALAAWGRRLLTKDSAIEAPSPPSSGITTHATR